jgi:hypothetical protein
VLTGTFPNKKSAGTRGRPKATKDTKSLDDPSEVLRRIASLASRLERVVALSEASGNVKDFTAVAQATSKIYEMCARLSGLISDKIVIQVTQSAVFTAFLDRIGSAVIECPTCSAKYEEALREVAERSG